MYMKHTKGDVPWNIHETESVYKNIDLSNNY